MKSSIMDTYPQGTIETNQTINRRGRKTKPVQMATDLTLKALLAKGLSQRAAADILGISATTVQRIKNRLREQGEELAPLVSARRNELAGQVLERFMEVGAKLPKTRIRGSDAIAAVKTYNAVAFPDQAPAGVSISFTAVHIHEARLEDPAGAVLELEPAPNTTRGIEPPRDGTIDAQFEGNQLLTESGNE